MLFLGLFGACGKQKNPVVPPPISLQGLNEEIKPEFQILTWPGGKPAAYTIEFDDARESHYRLAGPELARRGIAGTFNLNTQIGDWSPWIALAAMGHEMASHTVHHVDLTQLSAAQVEAELRDSQRAIEQYIGRKPVSFTAPMGKSNALVDSLAARYYLSCRCEWGINSSSPSESELYHLRGIGVYPPFSRRMLQKKLQEVVRQGGYLIVYFHSLVQQGELPNATFAPFSLFQEHLDDVLGLADSLWIAPRGTVVKYIRLREHARVRTRLKDGLLQCWLETDLDPGVYDVPLQVRWKIPAVWRGKRLWLYSSLRNRWRPLRPEEQKILSIRDGETITLAAAL